MNNKTPFTEDGFLEKIKYLMVIKKAFQDSELVLSDVSDALGMSKRETSQSIKTHFGKSFPDFLNDYRLKEVLKRFKNQDHKKHTIIAIALESGFPSKSTFYRYFKRKLHCPPAEFLLNHLD